MSDSFLSYVMSAGKASPLMKGLSAIGTAEIGENRCVIVRPARAVG